MHLPIQAVDRGARNGEKGLICGGGIEFTLLFLARRIAYKKRPRALIIIQKKWTRQGKRESTQAGKHPMDPKSAETDEFHHYSPFLISWPSRYPAICSKEGEAIRE
jgi:hypothetical protein